MYCSCLPLYVPTLKGDGCAWGCACVKVQPLMLRVLPASISTAMQSSNHYPFPPAVTWLEISPLYVVLFPGNIFFNSCWFQITFLENTIRPESTVTKPFLTWIGNCQARWLAVANKGKCMIQCATLLGISCYTTLVSASPPERHLFFVMSSLTPCHC